MSNLTNTIKIFTPAEYKNLESTEIERMLENEIAFAVTPILKLCNLYTWCASSSTLFTDEGKKVDLTKTETRFIKLLAEKKNEIVGYEEISRVVWEGKDMSVFTMRNIVNKIRQKSFYSIVKNISNQGYVLRSRKGE